MLFNEPKLLKLSARVASPLSRSCFSALQRAEIAEIWAVLEWLQRGVVVSVLFNEPKLLKSCAVCMILSIPRRFSALQRAEIAEM